MTISLHGMPARRVDTGRTAPWDESPNAPGVFATLDRPVPCAPENVTGSIPFDSGIQVGKRGSQEATAPNRNRDGYDEVDRRLFDTFPASDAVARY